jgi:hypothetical protein
VRERRREALGAGAEWDLAEDMDIGEALRARYRHKMLDRVASNKRQLVSMLKEPQAEKEAYAVALACTVRLFFPLTPACRCSLSYKVLIIC